jgi:hypothetical protein
MWRDFLGPLLGYDRTWLYSGASLDDDAPVDPIPAGTLVATKFGNGTVEAFSETGFYRVKLDFATASLRPSQIHCSTLPVEGSALHTAYTSKDKTSLPADHKCVAAKRSALPPPLLPTPLPNNPPSPPSPPSTPSSALAGSCWARPACSCSCVCTSSSSLAC